MQLGQLKKGREFEYEVITELLVSSQRYCRTLGSLSLKIFFFSIHLSHLSSLFPTLTAEKDPSVVSLRDVKRALGFMNFFLSVKSKNTERARLLQSIVLGLAFVYYYRQSDNYDRFTFFIFLFNNFFNNSDFSSLSPLSFLSSLFSKQWRILGPYKFIIHLVRQKNHSHMF